MFAFTTSAQSDATASESKAKTEKSSCADKADGEKKACCSKSATGEKKACSSEDKAASTDSKDGKACCASASTGDKKTCSAEEKAACASASKDGKACCSSASTGDKKTCSAEEKAACTGQKDGKACCAKTADAKSSAKPKVKTKTVKAKVTKISNEDFYLKTFDFKPLTLRAFLCVILSMILVNLDASLHPSKRAVLIKCDMVS